MSDRCGPTRQGRRRSARAAGRPGYPSSDDRAADGPPRRPRHAGRRGGIEGDRARKRNGVAEPARRSRRHNRQRQIGAADVADVMRIEGAGVRYALDRAVPAEGVDKHVEDIGRGRRRAEPEQRALQGNLSGGAFANGRSTFASPCPSSGLAAEGTEGAGSRLFPSRQHRARFCDKDHCP